MSIEDMFGGIGSSKGNPLFSNSKKRKKGKGKSTPKGASLKMQNQWKGFDWNTKIQKRKQYPDTDLDGTPDPWDCQPTNPLMQDTFSPMQLEQIKSLGNISVGKEIGSGAFGTVFEVKAKDPALQAIADQYVVKISNTAQRTAKYATEKNKDALAPKYKRALGYSKVHQQRYGVKPTVERTTLKYLTESGLENATKESFSVINEIKDYKKSEMQDFSLIIPQKPVVAEIGEFRAVGMLKPRIKEVAMHRHNIKAPEELSPELIEQVRKGTDEFTAKDFYIWDWYQMGVAETPEGEKKIWIFDTDVISSKEKRAWAFGPGMRTTGEANKNMWEGFVKAVEGEGIEVKNKNLKVKGYTGWKQEQADSREYAIFYRLYKNGKSQGYAGAWKHDDDDYSLMLYDTSTHTQHKLRFHKGLRHMRQFVGKVIATKTIKQAIKALNSLESEAFVPEVKKEEWETQADKQGFDELLVRFEDGQPVGELALYKNAADDRFVLALRDLEAANRGEDAMQKWVPQGSIGLSESRMGMVIDQIAQGNMRDAKGVMNIIQDPEIEKLVAKKPDKKLRQGWIPKEYVEGSFFIRATGYYENDKELYTLALWEENGKYVIGMTGTGKELTWVPEGDISTDKYRMIGQYEAFLEGDENKAIQLMNILIADAKQEKKQKGGWIKHSGQAGEAMNRYDFYKDGKNKGFMAAVNAKDGRKIGIMGTDHMAEFWKPGTDIRNNTKKFKGIMQDFLEMDFDAAKGNIKQLANLQKQQEEQSKAMVTSASELKESSSRPEIPAALGALFESPKPANMHKGWHKSEGKYTFYRNGQPQGFMKIIGLEILVVDQRNGANRTYSTGEWADLKEVKSEIEYKLQFSLEEILTKKKEHALREI
jgi:hypothetical protein